MNKTSPRTNEIVIGTWHETAAREITRCPSYYAADTETLRTRPGDYPAVITFEGGYTVPMPYWLLISIDTERVEGRLYSGFAGNNFAWTDLPAGEMVRHTIQRNRNAIADYVAAGKLTLDPRFAWLTGDGPVWQHPDAPRTWDDVRDLRKVGS